MVQGTIGTVSPHWYFEISSFSNRVLYTNPVFAIKNVFYHIYCYSVKSEYIYEDNLYQDYLYLIVSL